MDIVPLPIACTLTPAGLSDREARWRRLLDHGLLQCEARPDGVRLSFGRAHEATVRELVALEAECCAWFHSALSTEGEAVIVELTAAGDGPRALQAMFGAGCAPD